LHLVDKSLRSAASPPLPVFLAEAAGVEARIAQCAKFAWREP
jgi:hypothetical protein